MKYIKEFKLFEGLYSFNYIVPNKISDLLVDFYLLTLFKKSDNEILDYQLNDSKFKLLKKFKSVLIDLLYREIEDELTNIFSEFDLISFLEEQRLIPENDSEKLKKYDYINIFNDEYLIPNFDKSLDVNGFTDNDIVGNIKLASYLFGLDNWRFSYGGDKWKTLADETLKLYNIKDNDVIKLTLQIDHINDLEHNSGVIYTKIKSSEESNNIEYILDLKFKDNIPGLIELCNSNLKTLILRLYREQFKKTIYENKNNIKIGERYYIKDDLEKGIVEHIHLLDLLKITKLGYKIKSIGLLYCGVDLIKEYKNDVYVTKTNLPDVRHINEDLIFDDLIKINEIKLINTTFKSLQLNNVETIKSIKISNLINNNKIELLSFNKLKNLYEIRTLDLKINILNFPVLDNINILEIKYSIIDTLNLEELEDFYNDKLIFKYNKIKNLILSQNINALKRNELIELNQ